MKRILSLVLAMVMVLGSFSAVFAVEPTVADEAVEILMDLGVLTEGKLEQELRRQDTIVLLSRLMGEEEDAKDFPSEDLTFTDVTDPFYKGYIAWAVENDITDGKSATKFGFGDSLKTQELAMFLLRVLGYGDVEFDKALEKAEELGLLTNVNDEKIIKRGDMAVMTLNALLTNPKGSDVTLAEELGFEVTEVVTALAIKEVKATKANELTVTFNQAVDTEDVTVKVTRGTANVAGELKWNEDKTVAVYTTTAKMINGTYTVEATSKANEVTVKGATDVVSQFVNQIVVLNDVALTGKGTINSVPNQDAAEAYAYYDVLDQYGESVRNTTNITWSSSVKLNANRTTGKITLTRSDNKAFTYGEQIFLSGVDTKTGINVTKTLTVGQAQALNSVEVAGFVKKGTTEILKVLPSGFKAGTYNMIFEIKDQNGNPFTVKDYTELKDQVTFVSDNPLVISEVIVDTTANAIVIDGVEYHTAGVKPGMNVDRGGEVNILAIATRTGNKFTINTVVGEYQILTSFELLTPTDIVADGEKVEIPFNAYDQHGEKITNFRTIARNETFNTLTLTTSDSATLTLSENKDGTAKLTFADKTMGWTDSQTTDGHDRMVSLTSIVVGGNTSNLMLSIQDKARPMGIKNTGIAKVLVHQGATTVRLNNNSSTNAAPNTFTFVDQYGRDMTRSASYGFFNANFAGHNQDFEGYAFGVRVTYKGTQGNYNASGTAYTAPVGTTSDINNDREFIVYANSDLTLKADIGVAPTTAKTGMSVRFDIVKTKTINGEFKVEGVSPVKTEPLTIINIKQVKSIEVKDINKVYINTDISGALTGEGKTMTDLVSLNGTPNILSTHQRDAKLTGKYNNESVVIPTVYIGKSTPATGAAIKLEIDDTTTPGKLLVKHAADLKWSDLYDATTARYTRKDGEATITVNVYTTTAKTERLTTASRVVKFSDAAPRLATIDGDDEWAATPKHTNIVNVNGNIAIDGIDGIVDWFIGEYDYLDQYEVDFTPESVRYRISSIVENADGYAQNNFSYTGNDTPYLTIEGAERGDTFVITVLASRNNITVSKDVKVTVGADAEAKIGSGSTGNVYLKDLIGDKNGTGLEKQRLDSLE